MLGLGNVENSKMCKDQLHKVGKKEQALMAGERVVGSLVS